MIPYDQNEGRTVPDLCVLFSCSPLSEHPHIQHHCSLALIGQRLVRIGAQEYPCLLNACYTSGTILCVSHYYSLNAHTLLLSKGYFRYHFIEKEVEAWSDPYELATIIIFAVHLEEPRHKEV